MKYLYDELEKYCNDDYYPFHMPGHKRNTDYMKMTNPYAFDITEINGFDNLHHAEEILKDVQERAARLYGSEETHFLINGSTSGILSAISACVNEGGTILMARNSHKAVYNGVFLNKIKNVYTYPQKTQKKCVNCGLSIREIEQLLKNNKKIQLILITSPTYDGVVSDVREIAKLAHSYNIPLIVDEAHGAHFPFSKAFPEDSIKAGADIVIHSVHKTLPALTQTALLHINGNIVDKDRVKKYLAIYQTSSPSYVLMSSIDNCMRLIEEKGVDLFEKYEERLRRLRNSLEKLENLYMIKKEDLECFDYDNSKIIISTEKSNITGKELHEILLNKYHLEIEMSTNNYCLAMTSIMDTDEGFDRLRQALYEIDNELEAKKVFRNDKVHYVQNKNSVDCVKKQILDKKSNYCSEKTEEMQNRVLKGDEYSRTSECLKNTKYDVINEKVLEIWQVENKSTISSRLGESIGKIAGEYVYLYPPGIPIIVPGERISKEFVEMLRLYKEMNLNIEGMQDYNCEFIKIIEENV